MTELTAKNYSRKYDGRQFESKHVTKPDLYIKSDKSEILEIFTIARRELPNGEIPIYSRSIKYRYGVNTSKSQQWYYLIYCDLYGRQIILSQGAEERVTVFNWPQIVPLMRAQGVEEYDIRGFLLTVGEDYNDYPYS